MNIIGELEFIKANFYFSFYFHFSIDYFNIKKEIMRIFWYQSTKVIITKLILMYEYIYIYIFHPIYLCVCIGVHKHYNSKCSPQIFENVSK